VLSPVGEPDGIGVEGRPGVVHRRQNNRHGSREDSRARTVSIDVTGRGFK
jgi:hypothetical protein